MLNDRPSSPILNNRYQLTKILGTGGMAVVYLAQDMMLERPVAIKVLKQSLARDISFVDRFRHEARAAANLSHPNIVTVHDFGFDAGNLFIVMEYIAGTDLKTMIKNRGRFTLDETLSMMVQACAGIGYAHRAGLVHCDIKPHNILVTSDQRIKVTDFGIARALATISPDETSDVVWGSPQYFSPEQASGQAPSPSSDVYSLGVVIYEMLTGVLPFRSEDPQELARLHREASPPPLRMYNPDIPSALEQIILKVLSKEPSLRYRTADQLGRILASFNQQASTTYPVPNGVIPPAQVTPPPGISSTRPSRPASLPSQSDPEEASENIFASIDWLTIGLGLVTTLAVGGLIPFWLFIYFQLFPPLR